MTVLREGKPLGYNEDALLGGIGGTVRFSGERSADGCGMRRGGQEMRLT